ncbi:MAG: endonuclease [Chlorobiaceae bacterium]|nr:endonuclease [Chlorobiaceae bacterium]
MYFVYILRSNLFGRYYIGSTEDVEKRLRVHNSSQAKWTKRYQPWELVYQEKFETRSEAVRRERELKSLKNIEKFLKD